MKLQVKACLVMFALLVAALAPVHAEGELAGKLAGKLGISEAQSQGALQAVLGTVKERLSADEFSSLVDASPELSTMASKLADGGMAVGGDMSGKAAELSASAGEMAGKADEMAGEASAMGGAAEGMDLSALSKLTGLREQFDELGLEGGMVRKFVPALLEELGSGSKAAGLLKQGLGLM